MANATEFFDNLGKAISKTADKVAKKTDEFISVQKLRGRKGVLEAKLDNTFRRIGETVYEGRANQTEYSEEMERLCREIDEIRRAIEECRKEIALRKGEKICPACGANVPKDACFCMKCGHTMEDGGAEPASEKEEARDATGRPEKSGEAESTDTEGSGEGAKDEPVCGEFREAGAEATPDETTAAEESRQNISEEMEEDKK